MFVIVKKIENKSIIGQVKYATRQEALSRMWEMKDKGHKGLTVKEFNQAVGL